MKSHKIMTACFLIFCILSLNKVVFGQVTTVNWPPSPLLLENFTSVLPFSGSFTGWPQTQASLEFPHPGLSIDAEFGLGASKITRFPLLRYGTKIVVQINQFESKPGRPYGLHNILKIITDYEITNGIFDYQIVAINHSGGAIQLLNRNAATPHPDAINNVYQEVVEDLMAKGVKFYMCMNTARSKGIKVFHLIPGVQFVTSAPTAIVDFQRMDYKYLQP